MIVLRVAPGVYRQMYCSCVYHLCYRQITCSGMYRQMNCSGVCTIKINELYHQMNCTISSITSELMRVLSCVHVLVMLTVKMEVFIRYRRKLRSILDSNFVLVNSSQMLLPTEPLELSKVLELSIDDTYLH